MKRVIVFAAVLSLLIPVAAFAAPAQDNPSGMTKPAHGMKPVKPDKPGKPGKPSNGGGHQRPHKPGTPNKPGTKPPHKPGMKPPHNPGKPHKPGVRPPHKPGNRPGRPGHGYHKPRPNQYYWRGKWLSRVHASLFRYPAGYRYRVWNEGDLLPALFFSTAYYYDGYGQLGLETPPPGYRWVRYGPDLLLVDLNTHTVEQVVYGAFY